MGIAMFETVCNICGFHLFDCISSLSVSDLAFVDDNRYPGRCILGLRAHEELIDRLPSSQFTLLFSDVHQAARAIRLASGCDRVNVYLLGNREPHIHIHLVPRFNDPEGDFNPTHFEDKREKLPLSKKYREDLIGGIKSSLRRPQILSPQTDNLEV